MFRWVALTIGFIFAFLLVFTSYQLRRLEYEGERYIESLEHLNDAIKKFGEQGSR